MLYIHKKGNGAKGKMVFAMGVSCGWTGGVGGWEYVLGVGGCGGYFPIQKVMYIDYQLIAKIGYN